MSPVPRYRPAEKAWVEPPLFEDHMIATIGKLDLANDFDGNNVASG